MDESKLIATIERSKTADIRIRLVEFGARPFVDVRNFVDDGNGGERIPTRKGIALPPALVGQVIEALRKAEADV